ncbi:MAG: hypothetical protein KC589_08205 [Nanoarchaeota archaeon]|nr:hypothetical protein [Nanoarchaeota archaeon]
MNKFIYQIEKKELEENIELKLFIVNEKQKIEIEIINIPYNIILEKKGFDELNIKSDKIKISPVKLKNKKKDAVVKIEIENKELYEYLIQQVKDNNLEIYEADVPIEHQYLIDNEIEVNFEGEIKDKKKAKKEIKEMKYVSIDIETIGEKEKQEIVLISSFSPYGNEINKVYVNIDKINSKKQKEIKEKQFREFEIVIVQNEKELLSKFKEDIINFEAQVIIGWNVIDFDFKVIRERMKSHDIEFKFSKYCENECRLRINNDFFRDSTMNCEGLLVFDVIQLLKSNFISFEDYKLDTVAKEVLKDSKINLSLNGNEETIEDKLIAIENLLNKDPIKLIEYNFKDSYLTSQILEKLNLLELMCKRSILTGTPISRVKSPIATLDVMYLKKLHKQKIVASSNFNFTASNPIEGAYVIEPKKGFYEDMFVLDFKSLYPSIIMTFNIDPFTYDEGKDILAPNGAMFSSKLGILPELILKLYEERDLAKKEKDTVKSFVLKITMNSFYGAMASPKSRFYNKDVGGAITSFGRKIIQKAQSFVEEKGHKVVYGDTDSIFVKINGSKGKSFEDKKKLGLLLENELNKYFDLWIENEFKQKNYLNIELEKIYSKFFIASKKRYVGQDEINKKTQFVGMEAIRGDWTELAQRFQVNLVNLIFSGAHKEKINKFILEEIDNLKLGKFDSQLIYKKKITKPLAMYTKTTPPHVKAAREVKDFSGRLVKYVLTKDGPKHISLIEKNVNFDYDHYIEKQLMGVSDDLLECIGINFAEVVGKKKQKSLNSFFG